MKTLLITGASGGLGREAAISAAHRGAHVLCAGRDEPAIRALAHEIGGEPVLMDLASLAAVRRSVAELPQVDAVACNAGIQLPGEPRTTVDGFEETFQVNHLAHLMLVDEMLRAPTPPERIAFVGSGTHDPAIRTGTPDPLECDVPGMSRAEATGDDDTRTAGLRRYTTSKLLAVATARALAAEHPNLHISCFDPGLMPGTGLAREFPAPFRLLWNTVLKGLRVLPFASSPRASGTALARLLTAAPAPVPTGSYVDYRLKPQEPSERGASPTFQKAVLRDSRALIAG